LKDVSLSAAIAIDKRALLKGLPTRITETRSEKQRYETAVQQLQDELREAGIEVGRAEAIKLLSRQLPGISSLISEEKAAAQ